MTREELASCLADRPCQACAHHSAAGCRIWACAFDETKGGWSEVETLAVIRERKEEQGGQREMTFGKIADKIMDFYFEAVANDAIRKPWAWALYQTWKWVD